MNQTPTLSLGGATVQKSGRTILGPVDVDLFSDGATAVIGPNGAGKTTLLRCLFGLDDLASGSRLVGLPDVTMSIVFQTPVLLRRSVLANAVYPLEVRREPGVSPDALARCRLSEAGLGDLINLPAQTLSSGEKQRLALVRAMITDPHILFLDEPTANLDGRATREIETALASASKSGTKVILATHDLGQVRRLASEVVFLAGGKLVERGATPDFFANPKSAKAEAFLNGDIIE